MMRHLARLAGIAIVALAIGACTGTDSTFGVGGTDTDTAASAQFPDIDRTAAATGVQTAFAVPEIGRVYFAPIVGAPVDKVAALSKRLGPAGSEKGVRLVALTDASRTHEIKGYFSALSENGSTTVIHVWDVILPDGQRVHRIQGQLTVDGVSDDPWASVPPEAMETIATRIIDEYAAWIASAA